MDKNNDAEKYDVIVVGAGNAALCAALSAREQGATVLVLERSPKAERGGNSAFTDGVIRFAYRGTEDIINLSGDLTAEEIGWSDLGIYTDEQFFDDLVRVTQGRTDPDLCEILVKNSNQTLFWMKENGVRFMPNYGRQSFKVNGRFKFLGGGPMVVRGGGPELIEALYKTARKNGIEILYEAWVQDLVHVDGAVRGVVVSMRGATRKFMAGAVVLACGGF